MRNKYLKLAPFLFDCEGLTEKEIILMYKSYKKIIKKYNSKKNDNKNKAAKR